MGERTEGYKARGQRGYQQDAYLASPGLLVVADGMGGHEGGAEASAAAIATVKSYADDVTSESHRSVQSVFRTLEDLFGAAHHAVVRSGGGTTLTVAVESKRYPGRWVISACGDSPAFLVRNVAPRKADSVTRTTLLIQPHGYKHLLAKFLGEPGGGSEDPRAFAPEHAVAQVGVGDALILASDGLIDLPNWTQTPEAWLSMEVKKRAKGTNLAKALVEAALRAGSRDNTTVVTHQRIR